MSADKYPCIFSREMAAIVYIFANFRNCAHCVKDLKDNKDNSLHLRRKYARIFVLGHYLFLVAHSFPRASLSETVRFSEQIMSKDKYPSIISLQMATIVCIFSPQMEAMVFIILQIFFATRAIFKIGEYSRIFPVLAGECSVT